MTDWLGAGDCGDIAASVDRDALIARLSKGNEAEQRLARNPHVIDQLLAADLDNTVTINLEP